MITNTVYTSRVTSVSHQGEASTSHAAAPEATPSTAEPGLPPPSRRSSEASVRSRILQRQSSQLPGVSANSLEDIVAGLEYDLGALLRNEANMDALFEALATGNDPSPDIAADAQIEHAGVDSLAATAGPMISSGLEFAHAIEEESRRSSPAEQQPVTAADINKAFEAIEHASDEGRSPIGIRQQESHTDNAFQDIAPPQIPEHSTLAQRNFDAALAKLPGWRANIARNHPILNVGANYLTSLGRDGTITAMSTFARELVGYGVENWDKMTDERKVALSYSVMAMAIGLNAYSAARQHFKGTANNTTRVSQATNLVLMTMAMVLAAKTNTLGSASSLLVKGFVYSIIRDSANTFVLLNDAMDTSNKPPNLKSMFSNVSTYTAVSTAVNYLQSLPGVNSGTSSLATSLGLGKAIKGIIPFALANALGEGADGVHLPYWQAFYDSKRKGVDAQGAPKEPRRKPSDVVMVTKWRVPSMEQYLDKVSGLMNGRIAFFMVAYGLANIINNAGIKNPAAALAFSNVMLGFITGAFCPIFGGGAATSPARPRRSDQSAV